MYIQPNRLRLDSAGPGEPQKVLGVKQYSGRQCWQQCAGMAFDPEASEEGQVGEDEA